MVNTNEKGTMAAGGVEQEAYEQNETRMEMNGCPVANVNKVGVAFIEQNKCISSVDSDALFDSGSPECIVK